MRHVSACNVIERIFEILKQCFRILQLPPEYSMDVQALIPPALAALHNFIRQYDPEEIHMYADNDDNDNQPLDFQVGPPQNVGELGGPPTPRETASVTSRVVQHVMNSSHTNHIALTVTVGKKDTCIRLHQRKENQQPTLWSSLSTHAWMYDSS